jgi:integrase
VEQWLRHWIEHIAPASTGRSGNGLSAYEVAVRVHLIPGLGRHRIDRIQPEHFERFYKKMTDSGKAPATAHQVHRTARTAFGEAHRRGLIVRNPVALAKPPRVDEVEVEPYTVEEIRVILTEAATTRNSVRWAVALALGLRQGEALGLRWADVNLDQQELSVWRGRLRPKYKHGCNGGSCGHKFGGHCPQRVALRKETGDTKSKAGKRTIALPDELVDLLKLHHEAQHRERQAAGDLWQNKGYVFASETGEPLNPRTDYTRWKDLLATAGVRDGRLHDARHTAATVLLMLKVPERVVMALMGWSTAAMAARYQHVTGEIRKDVAEEVGGLIWKAVREQSGEAPEEVADEEADALKEDEHDDASEGPQSAD